MAEYYSLQELVASAYRAPYKRRHLTAAQRRRAIAKVVAARPDQSDRQIAKTFSVDHKTVGTVRRAKEATGEVSPVERTTGADGKSRPVKRKPPENVAGTGRSAATAQASARPIPENPVVARLLAECEEIEARTEAQLDTMTDQFVEEHPDTAMTRAELRQFIETRRGAVVPDEIRRLESALEDANTDLYELRIENNRLKALLADKPGVNKDELAEKLFPIMAKLKVQGHTNMATVAIASIADMGSLLEQYLAEWGVPQPKAARKTAPAPAPAGKAEAATCRG